MPLEDRRIIFKPDELYHAIYAHAKRADMRALPSGEIKGARFKDEHGDMVSLVVVNDVEKTTSTHDYGRAFVAAALIMYCRGVGIPVPKAANKSIEIDDGRIVLRAIM